MEITGKSRIMFILADPVGHVRAPAVLNAYFSSIGVDLAASPLHVAPADLPKVLDAIRSMKNVIGFGVTIPHKIAILDHLDEITEEARQIGAVNFVRKNADGSLTGTNTDGTGFVTGLQKNGVDPAGKRVLQLGAGGAGRAVAFALARAGVSTLRIENRDPARAQNLAAAVAKAFPATEVSAGPATGQDFDILVNTKSLGMKPDDPLTFDAGLIAKTPVSAEVIMMPPITKLLAEAERSGQKAVPGKAMLDAQMQLVAEFFKLN